MNFLLAALSTVVYLASIQLLSCQLLHNFFFMLGTPCVVTVNPDERKN